MITNRDVYSLHHTKQLVDEYLDDYLSQQFLRTQKMGDSYGRLLEIMQQHMAAGGKRLRPFLTLLAYQGYGGKDIDAVIPIACAWEFLHAALLVHDDIIDRDDVRHGTANIFGRYRAIYGPLVQNDLDHFATSSALLAGDLLISYSQQIVLTSELDSNHKIGTLVFLNKALFDVCGGELLDTETALFKIDQTKARLVAHYKTASYTFELPLQNGAMLAGAPAADLNKLQILGNKLGVAFQLVDDLLGVFGTSAATGKSIDTDIRERKHTVLVQQAYSLLPDAQRKELAQLYDIRSEITDHGVQRVRQLLVDSGAQEVVMAEAETLNSEAKTLIDELTMYEPAKQALRQLAKKILKRDS